MTPYYPQGNGQDEAINKTIGSILVKTVNDSYRDWQLGIPHALWSYRTSITTPTRVTSLSLIYGSEVVLPLEIEIPSLGITLQEYVANEAAGQARLDQLLILDEKGIHALEHMHVYQDRIKKGFDKKVKAHEFNIGDLVLKQNQQTSCMEGQLGDKFASNWLRPYIIKKKYGSGAYHVADMEGNEECKPINIMYLGPFYS